MNARADHDLRSHVHRPTKIVVSEDVVIFCAETATSGALDGMTAYKGATRCCWTSSRDGHCLPLLLLSDEASRLRLLTTPECAQCFE